MAEPIQFPEQNSIQHRDNEGDIPVYRDGQVMISCWELSPAEKMEIIATGTIWVSIAAPNPPPFTVGSGYPFDKVQN